ncbi:ovostatin-like [Pseudophryne corroboree]|uniref:ovostatin-like n=1 Tax=Pseudophryne corroboree TaxID=495146 RepID=UPI003081ECBE
MQGVSCIKPGISSRRDCQDSATMGLGRLLLSVTILLCLVAEGSADLKYVLSTPASLYSEETARLCIHLWNSNEHLDVNAVLQYNGKNTTIFAENVVAPEYFKCNSYQVPAVSISDPATILFSATGNVAKVLDRKNVVLMPTSNTCMFQMDKTIYKPGQKVRFRVVCLNQQLKAVNEKFPVMYLQDPLRTKIAQWSQQESDHGVVNLEFQLINDATPGSYMISAEREKGSPVTEWFTVQESVTPRFEIKVDAPNSLSVTTDELKFNVSAIYTYGEPVVGSAVVQYCKQPEFYGRRQNGSSCSNMTGELGPDGSYSGVIGMMSPTMRSMGRSTSLTLDITVVEAETDFQITETRYIYITSQPASLRLEYDSTNQYFKRGLDYPVVAYLKDENDQPMPDEDIDLDLEGQDTQTLKTDHDGRVEFQIDTSNMMPQNFTFKVSYKNPDQYYYSEWRDAEYTTAEYTAYSFYSQSGSFLQLKRPKGELRCGQTHKIDLQYTISPSGVGDGATKATIYYMTLSKSKIVSNGQKDVDLTNSRNGSLSLDVPLSTDLAPSADLVVYTILETELIADTIKLDIEKTFKNAVSMTFSAENGVPGSNVDVQVSADPNSICGLRVIDSSALLLNSFESFSADTVYNSPRYRSSGYNIGGYNVEDPAPPCEDGRKLHRVSSSTEGDSYNLLKGLGLHVATPLRMRKPEVCKDETQEIHPRPIKVLAKESVLADSSLSVGYSARGGGAAGSAPVETVRTNFPEGFMWLMLNLNTEGHGYVSEKVPDTITKCQGSAFCLSDEGGFGMTKYPANYNTSLLFFVELTLPYSFIRGETLVLPVIVRNYMDQCVKVQVTMEKSSAFTAELKGGEQGACICSKERATYTWEVQANNIGEINFTVSAQTTHIGQTCDGPNDSSQSPRKDTVVQSILVEPEGIRRELTLSNLVLAQSKCKNLRIPVSISLPENVVPDSPSAAVTASGDMFALSLQNLQDMVQKPHGCAEQTLALVAPIPAVLDYLNTTNQLTEEILEKAKGHMSAGYYRLLSFSNGPSFNLFRNMGREGNTWLTAFALRVLNLIKKYVYVDETKPPQMLIWLGNTQRLDNGCFKARGNVFAMEESDNDLYTTAYMAITLLETEYSIGKTLLDGCMECLKNASRSEQKIHIEVLMLYAFTLAKEWEYSDPLLEKLMKKAIVEGGTIHWEREQMPERPRVPFFLPPYASTEVDITSYALLSMAARPTISQEELTKMAQIGTWLSRNLNSHGGFGSSQSTVVGIQSLTALGQLLYTPNAQQTVAIKRGNGDVGSFNLNKNNRLLVQRQPLPDAKGDYSLEVGGTGWCLVQTTVAYNVPVPTENSAFLMEIETSAVSCVKEVAKAVIANVTLSYRGLQKDSGMVIVQIRPLSGYSTDFSTLIALLNQKLITKYEVNPKGDAVLYMTSVPRSPINLPLRFLMDQRVMKVKSSSGTVYSYYNEDENGYASFDHPCQGHK